MATPKGPDFSKNLLFYGDNLDVMRKWIKDDTVDLIYLDPPFNSNRTYNVLFKQKSGTDANAQITAFDDTWHPLTGTPYPKVQIASIAELLDGKRPKMPTAFMPYLPAQKFVPEHPTLPGF